MRNKRLKLFTYILSASLLLGGCRDISSGEGISVPVTAVQSALTEMSYEGVRVIHPDDPALPVHAPSDNSISADTQAYHERMEQIRQENGAYGMGIAVFRDGDIIYTDSFGLADMENEIPCSADTRFRAASVSKVVSTILVMKLCDEEMITTESVLDDATGLPFSIPSVGEVRLRHLLTHTAGITDTDTYETGAAAHSPVETVLKHSLTGIRPGTFYNYTNFGAGTMGAVIEHLTGMFFHDYAEKVLFEPLGMDAGYTIDLIDNKESCAVIYDHDGTVYDVPEWDRTRDYYEQFGLGNSYLQAQCELLITPADLARLATALAGDGTVRECGGKRILSEDSVNAMHNVYIDTEKFGMGLNIRRYENNLVEGRTLWGHPGNALGAITGLFYDRTDKTGVVVMTNHCDYYMDDGSGLYRLVSDTVRETYSTFFPQKKE